MCNFLFVDKDCVWGGITKTVAHPKHNGGMNEYKISDGHYVGCGDIDSWAAIKW